MANQSGKPETVFVPKDRRAHQDQVKLDGVMKEFIRTQTKSKGVWESRWAFLKNPRQHWEAEAKSRGLSENIFDKADERRLPQQWPDERKPTAPLQACETPPTLSSDDWKFAFLEVKSHKPFEVPLKPNFYTSDCALDYGSALLLVRMEDAKKKTPQSGIIGWRSKDSMNRLDLLAGPLYTSPRHTMEPPLGPNEPDPKKQRFIFLG